ncbi:uncharacterized protein LOC128651758 [Bombina bombina]|uniref:uncharacterized protein LOC128651758 n=1 Tax=Bombina bombina TaxID=8345 RepID=UPI00235A5E12|nr:uncharacterized protein LOC128651758 [Bombina bombina]
MVQATGAQEVGRNTNVSMLSPQSTEKEVYPPEQAQQQEPTEVPSSNAGENVVVAETTPVRELETGAAKQVAATGAASGDQGAKQDKALRVWIVGHSYVYWAQARAAASAQGVNLGLSHKEVSIRWVGKRGMMWDELVPTIQLARRRWGCPDAIIIHLGGNDIGAYPLRELEEKVAGTMRWLRVAWPSVRAIWSNIVSRIFWRNSYTSKAGYRSRRKVNQVAAKVMKEIGGRVVEHPLIAARKEELFRRDGVHLTDEGNDQLLVDIRGMCQELVKTQQSTMQ